MSWDGQGPPGYSKPHLPFDEQLSLLADRGLEIRDSHAALQALKRIGYYRLSAYLYPLREMLPEPHRCTKSPVSFRSSAFLPGATFEQALALWDFDRKLRLLMLDGLERVEISMRTSVAYVLGEADPFGHLRRSALDPDACLRTRQGDAADAFELWCRRYEQQQREAEKEDFVRHHVHKYGEPLPIWVAVEFLDFGSVVRLFGLMKKQQQDRVARMHGVKGAAVFRSWMRQLNYLRNASAHHSRLWNRTLTIRSATWKSHQVPVDLAHALAAPHDRIYVPAAITATLIRQIEPRCNWPLSLRTLMRKFPAVPGQTPETSMGFPSSWADLPLWSSPVTKP